MQWRHPHILILNYRKVFAQSCYILLVKVSDSSGTSLPRDPVLAQLSTASVKASEERIVSVLDVILG